jgi:copper chaperone CopZ
MRSLMMVVMLGLAAPALACPMADKAAYEEALKEVQSSKDSKAAFNVKGMDCGDCTTKITAALTKIDGVTAAAVDYQTGRAEVAFNGEKTSADALLKVIRSTGFKADKS